MYAVNFANASSVGTQVKVKVSIVRLLAHNNVAHVVSACIEDQGDGEEVDKRTGTSDCGDVLEGGVRAQAAGRVAVNAGQFPRDLTRCGRARLSLRHGRWPSEVPCPLSVVVSHACSPAVPAGSACRSGPGHGRGQYQ